MKLLFALLLLCFAIAFSTQSCQKDSTPPKTDTLIVTHVDTLVHIDTLHHSDTIYVKKPTSIFGLWIGTYDITKGPQTGMSGFYYSYELHTDSSIQMTSTGSDGLTYYGNGTWSLHNTSFSAHILTTNLSNNGIWETVQAAYDSVNSKLSGIATQDLYSNYQANFVLEKVP